MRNDKCNAVEKALKILLFFAHDNTPIGTSALAEAVNLNKATTSRLLITLKNYGFLNKDSETSKYSLAGATVSQFWHSVTRDLDGQSIIIAQPFCDQLRDAISETVHFEILSGSHMFLAYAARCHNPISVSISIGDRVQPHTHVGAKCIAAYSHPHLVRKWLGRCLSDSSKIDSLFEEYRQILLRRISIDDGQFDRNIFAIAAPVFDRNSRAIASVVALAPLQRKERLMSSAVIDSMRDTARKISTNLMCPDEYDELCEMYSMNYM